MIIHVFINITLSQPEGRDSVILISTCIMDPKVPFQTGSMAHCNVYIISISHSTMAQYRGET